jgi:hypothetical protein
MEKNEMIDVDMRDADMSASQTLPAPDNTRKRRAETLRYARTVKRRRMQERDEMLERVLNIVEGLNKAQSNNGVNIEAVRAELNALHDEVESLETKKTKARKKRGDDAAGARTEALNDVPRTASTDNLPKVPPHDPHVTDIVEVCGVIEQEGIVAQCYYTYYLLRLGESARENVPDGCDIIWQRSCEGVIGYSRTEWSPCVGADDARGAVGSTLD